MSTIPTQGHLNITIQMPGASDGGGNAVGGGGDTPTPENPRKEANTSPDPKGNNKSQLMMATAVNAAVSLGKQGIQTGVSVIGVSTGNYYQQQKIETGLQNATEIVGLGVAAFTNPWTAGVAIVGKAISIGAQIYKENTERKIDNYNTAQYARRIGYTKERK